MVDQKKMDIGTKMIYATPHRKLNGEWTVVS
jgi:hypothetical protein